MRWLLLPLLVLVLLAPTPSQGCPRQVLVKAGETVLVPPLAPGSPAAFFGTDADGRDNGCLVASGLRRSLQMGLSVLLLALPLGLVLGLGLGWRGWNVGLYGEIFVLAGLMLLAGSLYYREVLALGLAVYMARTVAVRVRTVLLEPFLEGAWAVGGGTLHILIRHVLPHLAPVVPGLLATSFGLVFLWMAELAVLGYYDQGGYFVQTGSGFETVPMRRFLPLNPDLGQLIGTARFEWLFNTEQLLLPALMLVLLTLAFSDLGRALSRHR
ncbi:MAG TPA: hypothetical protein VFS50_02250 [Meiothermus sp.]|nr:hypothetical protein [Meiothermus sp.]